MYFTYIFHTYSNFLQKATSYPHINSTIIPISYVWSYSLNWQGWDSNTNASEFHSPDC